MNDEQNSPWDAFDTILGRVRDGLAAIGVLALIMAIGYWSGL